MHKTNLRKVGGSVMLVVPPAMLDLLALQAGASVSLTVADGRLIVEPQPGPVYSLEELLARCDAGADIDPGDREWLDGQPVGNELL